MLLRRSTFLVVLLAVAAIAGCGRKAPLDSPFDAASEARRQAIEDEAAIIPPEPARPVRNKPFILDPLI